MYQVHQGGHAVSRTTTQSYGSQVGESFLMAGFGFLVVGGSLALIWLNEARQYNQTRALREVRQQLVSVSDYLKENEGKVVYVSGALTSHEEVKDDRIEFEMKSNHSRSSFSAADAPPPPYVDAHRQQQPIERENSFRNFLQLNRRVEMLQWDERQQSETKHKIGEKKEVTTLYSYLMVWKDRQIRSENFEQPAGHHNPDMPITSEVFRPSVFYLAQFVVPSNVADCLVSQPVFPPAVIYNRHRVEHDGSKWYVIRKQDPREEQVGDLRISYSSISGPQTVSIIGKQQGVSIVPCEGLGSLLCAPGQVSPIDLLSSDEQANRVVGSSLRWLGGIGSIVGFRLLFDPLVTGAVVVPFFSDLVGVAAWGIALPLGITAAVITIPFAKLHCRSNKYLKLPVAVLYAGSLVGGMGLLSVGIARVLQKIMPTRDSVQARAEGLGSRVGSVFGAFDNARKHH